MTEPTQESLEEAAMAAGYTEWEMADRHANSNAVASIIAHARTLDKLLGREPVDPVKALAAEMAAERGVTGASSLHSMRSDTFRAALEVAIRRGMTLAPKAEPKPWTDEEIGDLYVRPWRNQDAFILSFRAHLKERGE